MIMGNYYQCEFDMNIKNVILVVGWVRFDEIELIFILISTIMNLHIYENDYQHQGTKLWLLLSGQIVWVTLKTC